MNLQTSNLPPELAAQADIAWGKIIERADEGVALRLREAADRSPVGQQLARVLACSPFVVELARRKPGLLAELLDSDFLVSSLPGESSRRELASALDAEGADLGVELRRYRQRHMLRIVWRDFCRLADTLETVRDTSLLAEACIAEAAERAQAALEQRFGRPIGRESKQPQKLIVLAMGKLGARELNVSSDIDLIFAFPEAGSTDGEKR